jgi:hypothetical protein
MRRWEGLTDAQRLAWETVARQRPVPDRFGVERYRSGRELFLTVPHDWRFGVGPFWQDVPPTRSVGWITDPVIDLFTATTLQVSSTAEGPASNWVASAWFARWTKSYKRQHRGWFKGGLDVFNQVSGFADFGASMAALDVEFVTGEQVAVMVQYWHEGWWPTWWDFGVLTVP